MIIMLVDDDSVSSSMLAEFLTKIDNRVIECIDADLALRIFPTEDFNMIISNYKMPGINSLELLHNIRNLPGGRDIHTLDAMITYRYYRDGVKDLSRGLAELVDKGGSQFDEHIVNRVKLSLSDGKTELGRGFSNVKYNCR